MITRDEAYKLLCEYTKKEALIKHALAVEQAMRSYAKKFNDDEEKWAITGLLHDFDYEMFPTYDKHPFEGAKILKEKAYPEDIIEAILGHGNHTKIPRKTNMAKALYAVDELTGFIIACVLVRPDKKITGLEVRSVIKRMKDKAFARAVNRDELKQSALELGVDFEEHVDFVIRSLTEISDKLGV
jgi:putative nucleotidyltransferase with HDIG domain